MSEEMLSVNGEETFFAPGRFPASVTELVSFLGLDAGMLVAEINGDIVSRNDFASHRLKPGDRIELVRFVGGG